MDNRLRLLAYRPLGGRKSRSRTAANPVLGEIAAQCGATPFDIALAWLAGLSEHIVPLPGATGIDNARSIARYRTLRLTGEQIVRLDELCPHARLIRNEDSSAASIRPPGRTPNSCLIMGLPGAGKSTMALEFVNRGYLRLNRDETGGHAAGSCPRTDRVLASGTLRRLHNRYVSRVSRAAVIQAAAARGVAVRCVWLSTSVAEAQVNAVTRIVERYGKLLDVDELASHRKRDPAALPPMTQFRDQRELEAPDVADALAQVDVVPFERRADPSFAERAVLIWCDGISVWSHPMSVSRYRSTTSSSTSARPRHCAGTRRKASVFWGCPAAGNRRGEVHIGGRRCGVREDERDARACD